VKHNFKSILSLLIFLMVLTICTGCNGSNPVIPAVNPNPPVNPENSTVSYVEVTASPSTIKVNQELQLVVKGYNSEDEWVVLDKSNIKLWKWTVQGQCYNCILGDVSLNPKSNSLTATFASKVAGTFFIAAYYQENIADDYIADYVEIKVN
jgi:hypothetical protein